MTFVLFNIQWHFVIQLNQNWPHTNEQPAKRENEFSNHRNHLKCGKKEISSLFIQKKIATFFFLSNFKLKKSYTKVNQF